MQKGRSYPPSPWILEGRGAMSLWLVPAGSLPIDPSVRPLSIFGRWVVSVACLAYGGESVLSYNELLVGVAVREGGKLGVHIPYIWVDSRESRQGGRALWAIPKEMATFRKAYGLPAVIADGVTLARMDVKPRWPIPRRWTIGSRTVQYRGEEKVVTPFRTQTHFAWCRAQWEFAGVLSFLEGKRPFLSIGLSRARLEFGR